MTNMTMESSRCPLCGQPNECGIAAGKSTCWCFTTKVPAEVLKKISPAARGVACVCKACATGQRSPAKTLDRLQALPRERA